MTSEGWYCPFTAPPPRVHEAEWGCFTNHSRCPEGRPSFQTRPTARFLLLEAGRGLQDAGTTYRGCIPSGPNTGHRNARLTPTPKTKPRFLQLLEAF